MAHIQTVAAARPARAPQQDASIPVGLSPVLADAKTDRLNSIYWSLQDRVLVKKTNTPM